MRISGIVIASAAVLLFSGAAMAQSMGGSMKSGTMMKGPAMSGPGMKGPAMKSGAMKGPMPLNKMGGVSIFSRENMAMMIVARERATKGMTAARPPLPARRKWPRTRRRPRPSVRPARQNTMPSG